MFYMPHPTCSEGDSYARLPGRWSGPMMYGWVYGWCLRPVTCLFAGKSALCVETVIRPTSDPLEVVRVPLRPGRARWTGFLILTPGLDCIYMSIP